MENLNLNLSFQDCVDNVLRNYTFISDKLEVLNEMRKVLDYYESVLKPNMWNR